MASFLVMVVPLLQIWHEGAKVGLRWWQPCGGMAHWPHGFFIFILFVVHPRNHTAKFFCRVSHIAKQLPPSPVSVTRTVSILSLVLSLLCVLKNAQQSFYRVFFWL
jgi:hypothetical protein